MRILSLNVGKTIWEDSQPESPARSPPIMGTAKEKSLAATQYFKSNHSQLEKSKTDLSLGGEGHTLGFHTSKASIT